ncbi:hypothetical protein SAMN06265365_10888 [Tistlia consotensis]|uniref:Uncharacterized protein n=1 Tax=Tistlia consotensis USBA 355 TaxID=560819 RepID=A0A1Y6BWB3_9PROT|nr:hypothetical protein [Tistlia consotensis]SMF24440.1 hypothetical protein SAMN05428998_10892 [Tistlia consotensis USBA 355]SNR60525.1 hypothetical protein SAMN06265365_10888 [Tistlia consotensis]
MSVIERLATPWQRRRVEVREGLVFRARVQNGMLETARVLAVVADPMGISHVSYELTIERSEALRYDYRRTLNLESFIDRYQEPVGAA